MEAKGGGVFLSLPGYLLLAVVVSSLDGLGHVSQGGEAWLSGQSIGGQSLQTLASCLSLLQGGETSDVLPPDQTQRVLQIPLPQCCLRNHNKLTVWIYRYAAMLAYMCCLHRFEEPHVGDSAIFTLHCLNIWLTQCQKNIASRHCKMCLISMLLFKFKFTYKRKKTLS